MQVARDFLQREARRFAEHVEISIHPPEDTARLSDCSDLEAFLPPGKRAWGRLLVGVRCRWPVEWSVFLQARVMAPGDYVATRRSLRAGQTLSAEDIELRQGDLADLPDDTLIDTALAIGQRLRHTVTPGQPIRQDMLQPPLAIRQGETVRIIVRGAGFQVISSGVALNDAAAGERVRLRMESGKTVQATATPDGRAALGF